MNRTTLSILLLFVLILILNAPFFEEKPQSNTDDSRPEAWSPNYQARNMQSTLYNKQGDVNHEVFATSMEHYDILGFTLFENPEYTIFTERSEQPWKVNALEGTLYEDNRIELEQKVIIESLSEGDFVQRIETDFIEIDLNTKTMHSDQLTTISGVDFVITSNGFNANLLTRKFELINHVQTVYNETPAN
ncbi:MAG: LPS export ABC transporter periplasmic protein LptC [Aestuariibacter sp.]